MTTESMEALIAILERCRRDPTRFYREDMDEIAILTTIEMANLPLRFVELVRLNDTVFPQSNEGKAQILDRLERILSVSKNFPTTEIDTDFSDSLMPTFHLINSDKERVMELCQDMRKIVFASPIFDEPHKRRLLNRIAAIEKQVLQLKGLFDVVRGGINDIGETLGKFGVDIKPLTDRMTEVVKIVRRSTKEYDQLPPPEEVKKLPPPPAA